VHSTTLYVLDPVRVLLVLLAGIGIVLCLCALGYAAEKLLDLVRSAPLAPGRSQQ
jgi:hypothetical protein